jgi:L-fucose isomerase-like protein
MSSGLQSIDAAAHLRARGFEGYAALDYYELNKLIRYLKTRKVFQQTNILLVTNMPMPAYSELSSVWDFDDLANRFGIGTKIINYGILIEEMERVINSKDEEKRAQELADKVIKNAQGVYLDKKYVFNSAQFYCTVKNLMNKYNCNAFTIECWEFCTSRNQQNWKIVPCLIHSLLKDEGYASACQADISALLAMQLFMTLANRSVFMGNQFMDMATELLMIGHSVPGLKMNGYNQPDLPYTLRHFCESGWGTKVMVDFAANNEKIVTLVNTDPLARKLMVAKGVIEKCIGFKEGDGRGTLIGCSLQAHLKLRDYRDFMYKQADFGTHVAMGYGDYIEDFKKLGPIIGMDVVDCS